MEHSEILLICIATFGASVLTFFSGFGLGTILMPVMALFLPVPIAIAVTAVVHFLNKIFKLLFLWWHVDMRILIMFGFPAMLAAVPGAMLLDYLSRLDILASYMAFGGEHNILPVKVAAGVLLILFAAAEQSSFLKLDTLKRYGLVLGGVFSGFFGGLSGHQGALRSVFLARSNLSEKSFIATNAAIAALVDAMRLLVYGLAFDMTIVQMMSPLVTSAIASSFLGVFLAARFLAKVTIRSIQQLVAAMMYVFGVLLIVGLI
jgi:uncharacterized protein